MSIFNKKWILAIALTIAILLSGVFLYLAHPWSRTSDTTYREITLQSTRKMFSDVNELEKWSDLIIVGKTEKDFFDLAPSIIYSSENYVQDFYTITDVKISKVIKGEYSKSSIPVVQSAALDTPKNKQQKELLISDGCSVMQKGEKYLLFLRKTDIEGVYGILSVNQGKFNLDSLDTKEKDITDKDEQLQKLRQSVMERYKDNLD